MIEIEIELHRLKFRSREKEEQVAAHSDEKNYWLSQNVTSSLQVLQNAFSIFLSLGPERQNFNDETTFNHWPEIPILILYCFQLEICLFLSFKTQKVIINKSNTIKYLKLN